MVQVKAQSLKAQGSKEVRYSVSLRKWRNWQTRRT